DECKKKLKNLKDRIREISAKLPKTKSGQSAFDKGETTVRWPFYKPLLFMRDQFVGRPMVSNVETEVLLGASAIYSDAEESDDGASLTTDTPTTTQPSTSTEAMTEKPPAKKVMKVKHKSSHRQVLEEELLSIEREKMNSMKKAIEVQQAQQEQDEWDQFTSAICCDLQKLKDPVLIMQAKINITRDVSEVVMEQLMLAKGTRPSTSTNMVRLNAPVHEYQSGYPGSVHMARKQFPGDHKNHVHTKLDHSRPHAHLKPVYERLSHPDLLTRCLGHKTQNANESLHNKIWSKCNKLQCHSHDRVEFSLLSGIAEFNFGPSAITNILEDIYGIEPGQSTTRLRAATSRKRLDKS
ncbi:hypothetical protein ElyMa_000608300, partial [Elysia marginata]